MYLPNEEETPARYSSYVYLAYVFTLFIGTVVNQLCHIIGLVIWWLASLGATVWILLVLFHPKLGRQYGWTVAFGPRVTQWLLPLLMLFLVTGLLGFGLCGPVESP